MNSLVPLPPPKPWLLAELERHTNACPLCSSDRACQTGVALAGQWLQHEADENGSRVTIVPNTP